MEQEKKKSNKKLFIIIVAVLFLIMICYNWVTSFIETNKINNISDFVYGNTQINHMNKGILVEDTEYIYYSVKDYRDSYYIFKQSKQDNTKTELTSAEAKFLNIYNNQLYYINEDEHAIFKMNTDGSNRNRILDRAKAMYIVNDYLYYIEGDSFYNNLRRLDLTTNKVKDITDEDVREFTIYNGYIYYVSGKDNQLYKVNLLGKEKQSVFTDKVENICIINDNIFVSNITDGNSIYKLSLDGKENKKIITIEKDAIKLYSIVNNQIVTFTKFLNNYYLCLYDFEGQQVKRAGGDTLTTRYYTTFSTSLGTYGNMLLLDSGQKFYTFLDLGEES